MTIIVGVKHTKNPFPFHVHFESYYQMLVDRHTRNELRSEKVVTYLVTLYSFLLGFTKYVCFQLAWINNKMMKNCVTNICRKNETKWKKLRFRWNEKRCHQKFEGWIKLPILLSHSEIEIFKYVSMDCTNFHLFKW